MKTIGFYLRTAILSCLALLAVSCVKSLPSRLDELVEYVQNSEALTEEDWQIVEDELYMISEEFKANLNSYSEEEKKDIYAKIGKLNGVIARNSANDFIDSIKELGNSLPSAIEGFINGFAAESDSIDLN